MVENNASATANEAGHLMNEAGRLFSAGQLPQCAALLEKILKENPGHAEALNMSGVILYKSGNLQRAEKIFSRAVSADPQNLSALSNWGGVLGMLDRHEESLLAFNKALKLNPGFTEGYLNRAVTLRHLGRHEEALESFDAALKQNPDHPSAHWGASLCSLTLGDFRRGWKEYEWRWQDPAFARKHTLRNFTQPLWLGKEPLAGKTILLHAEQGLGDTIQFCRLVKSVAKMGATVLLEVQPPLKSLLSGLPGARQVFAKGDELPRFDFHCPLLSLPLALELTLDSIPSGIPYIAADKEKTRTWREKIRKNDDICIGVAWSGAPSHQRDTHRSIPAKKLLPLLSLPGIRFVSLQKETRPDDAKVISQNPAVTDISADLHDYADTAALIENLDLVISVDTSVAHLAGAMGKPLWLLIPFYPDWRWLLNREDSPWYPTARLFRQPRCGDWDSVIEKIIGCTLDFT